jgi:hypothetical protein
MDETNLLFNVQENWSWAIRDLLDGTNPKSNRLEILL